MFLQLLKEWKGEAAGERIEVPDEYAPDLLDSKTTGLSNTAVKGVITTTLEQATQKRPQSMDQVINWKGLDTRDIGRILGIHPNQVSSEIAWARRQLRERRRVQLTSRGQG